MPLADLAVNFEDADDVKAMPLLEVREVGRNMSFTGRLFASAAGDGLLRITHPYLNWELEINSRSYTEPTRMGAPIEE